MLAADQLTPLQFDSLLSMGRAHAFLLLAGALDRRNCMHVLNGPDKPPVLWRSRQDAVNAHEDPERASWAQDEVYDALFELYPDLREDSNIAKILAEWRPEPRS